MVHFPKAVCVEFKAIFDFQLKVLVSIELGLRVARDSKIENHSGLERCALYLGPLCEIPMLGRKKDPTQGIDNVVADSTSYSRTNFGG